LRFRNPLAHPTGHALDRNAGKSARVLPDSVCRFPVDLTVTSVRNLHATAWVTALRFINVPEV